MKEGSKGSDFDQSKLSILPCHAKQVGIIMVHFHSYLNPNLHHTLNVTVGYATVGGVMDGDSCMPAVGQCIFEQVMSPFVLTPPTILFIVLLCNIVFNDIFPPASLFVDLLCNIHLLSLSPYKFVHSVDLQY